MKKTLLIALLSLLISMVLAGSTTLAEESISPMIQPGDTAVMWVIKSKTSIGDTNGERLGVEVHRLPGFSSW